MNAKQFQHLTMVSTTIAGLCLPGGLQQCLAHSCCLSTTAAWKQRCHLLLLLLQQKVQRLQRNQVMYAHQHYLLLQPQ